jgi:hypothetical protein
VTARAKRCISVAGVDWEYNPPLLKAIGVQALERVHVAGLVTRCLRSSASCGPAVCAEKALNGRLAQQADAERPHVIELRTASARSISPRRAVQMRYGLRAQQGGRDEDFKCLAVGLD